MGGYPMQNFPAVPPTATHRDFCERLVGNTRQAAKDGAHELWMCRMSTLMEAV